MHDTIIAPIEKVDPRALPPTEAELRLKWLLLALPPIVGSGMILTFFSGLASRLLGELPMIARWITGPKAIFGWLALTFIASGWFTQLRLRRQVFGLELGIIVALWAVILTLGHVLSVGFVCGIVAAAFGR